MNSLFEKLGITVPEIMLPCKGTDLAKWAVIACDQYTSQPEYWEKVRREVGGSPSTLNMIFPEVYLRDGGSEARINRINETMEHYMDNGVLKPLGPGFILVERNTPLASSRKGLILAVDLERYDYRKGSRALIRATEETVLDRIPPRVKIRENALVELPHIMLLIDDPGKTVIEPLYERVNRYEKLYDFDLMMGGGHIKGWKVDDDDSLSMVARSLGKLAGVIPPAAENVSHAAGVSSGDVRDISSATASATPAAGVSSIAPGDVPPGTLLFAVGDGNHSLAAAKSRWENVKSRGNAVSHPARYALVEVVNIHDDGLVFEPIHRILSGIDGRAVLEQLKNAARRVGLDAETRLSESGEANERAAGHSGNRHIIPFILEGSYGLFTVNNPACGLEAGTLQAVLDELLKGDAGMEIDYIHGDGALTGLGSKKGCMGFFMPVMNKYDLFKTVISDGVLPRKTFSMGVAEEKRYYLECRRIR